MNGTFNSANKISREMFAVDDSMEKDVLKLVKTLDKIGRVHKDNVMQSAMLEAGTVLNNAQKELIDAYITPAGNSVDFSKWITLKIEKTEHGWKLVSGYDKSVFDEKHLEVAIIEYGRPGKKKHGKLDSMGRKISVIQPYSHIRAGMFKTKKAVIRIIAERLVAEVKRLWRDE